MVKKGKKVKKNTKKILIILLLIVLMICIGIIVNYYYKQFLNDRDNENLQQQKLTKEDMQEQDVEIPVDFDALQQQNPDIYAWIEIPGTVIDYPVLRNEENTDYYLKHTAEKTEGLPGAIYTQNANAADFSDNVTVIYGHNMKNKTMFGELHNYEEEDFFKKTKTIYIYTPEHILTYQIFAAHIYDDRLIIDSFDTENTQGFQQYLDSIYASRNMVNHFDNDTKVTTNDRIITLSTCVGGQNQQRYLVQAVLVDEK